ncbi:MAG: DUF411 domain-containing protein [Patescibacteria group bacterium]
MKKYSTHWILLLGGIIFIGGLVVLGNFTNKPDTAKTSMGLALQATVYKTPTCGCCHVYAQYLEHEGLVVETNDVPDLAPIKNQYGIPANLQSCHTSIINGYVVEGHIPLAVISKLISEKPDIKGIALPGMPSGSPGMPGPKTEPWTIFALGKDGSVSEFMKY